MICLRVALQLLDSLRITQPSGGTGRSACTPTPLSVAVPTTRGSRAQFGLVTHGRAFYRLTRAREYHVNSTDVNPAIAEPVSLTERSSA